MFFYDRSNVASLLHLSTILLTVALLLWLHLLLSYCILIRFSRYITPGIHVAGSGKCLSNCCSHYFVLTRYSKVTVLVVESYILSQCDHVELPLSAKKPLSFGSVSSSGSTGITSKTCGVWSETSCAIATRRRGEEKQRHDVVQNASFKPKITLSGTGAGPRKQGSDTPMRSALKSRNIRPGQYFRHLQQAPYLPVLLKGWVHRGAPG